MEVRASDGVRLYAEAHGDGIPLVLSCAYCTTHENFRPQVDPLVRAGVRVVLWDYRGHGLSEAPADPAAYSMDQVVDDLARVADLAAPDRPVVLGGLSFGGLASLHLALRRPERVRALVLVGSGPGFKNADAQARWETMVERTASFVEKHGCAAFVASKASATLVGCDPELPAAQAAGRAIAAQDPRGLANFGRRVSGLAPSVIDDLGRIEVPTLVLVGELDEGYHRAAEVMAARIPKAQRVVVPGAGHIVNIEAQAAFDRALVGFLQGLASDRGRSLDSAHGRAALREAPGGSPRRAGADPPARKRRPTTPQRPPRRPRRWIPLAAIAAAAAAALVLYSVLEPDWRRALEESRTAQRERTAPEPEIAVREIPPPLPDELVSGPELEAIQEASDDELAVALDLDTLADFDVIERLDVLEQLAALDGAG